MRRRPVTLILLLLAASAAGAEGQGGAPLESSKQALKTLQSDQSANDRAAAAGKLTDGLPRLETPVPGAVAREISPPDDARRKEMDLKNNRQKNWLLDGVDKLGRDAKSRKQTGKRDRASPTDEEEEALDSSDPDYVLRLYADQKRQAEGKSATRQTVGARNDPIAPFLQDWLGNSPVREKFFDEFVRKTNTGGPTVSSAGLAGTGQRQDWGGTVTVENSRGAPASAPQPNPYLAGLESPSAPDPESDRLNASLTAPTASGDPVVAPTAPAGAPIPAARPAVKKPPLLAPSDNEKYFPQQKKF